MQLLNDNSVYSYEDWDWHSANVIKLETLEIAWITTDRGKRKKSWQREKAGETSNSKN